MTKTTRYAVIPSTGTNAATVLSTHRTLAAARKAATGNYLIVARDGVAKGDTIYRDTIGTVFVVAEK